MVLRFFFVHDSVMLTSWKFKNTPMSVQGKPLVIPTDFPQFQLSRLSGATVGCVAVASIFIWRSGCSSYCAVLDLPHISLFFFPPLCRFHYRTCGSWPMGECSSHPSSSSCLEHVLLQQIKPMDRKWLQPKNVGTTLSQSLWWIRTESDEWVQCWTFTVEEVKIVLGNFRSGEHTHREVKKEWMKIKKVLEHKFRSQWCLRA